MREPSAPARQKILAEVTKGYSAIVDGPGCFFVQDWIEMYPDAKVVLGLRKSPEVWLASMNGSIAKVFGQGLLYWLAYFVPEMYFGFTMNNLWEAQTRKQYGVSVMTEEYYSLHNDYIRSIVPSDRLLEFQASDGWGPLAMFLGEAVPIGTFPHKNDAGVANGLIKSFVVYGVGVWTIILACACFLVKGSMIYLKT